MSGTLKLGLVNNEQSIWLDDKELKVILEKKTDSEIRYLLSGSLLKEGTLTLNVLSLSSTDGVIVRMDMNDIPSELFLVWAYGGASGSNISPTQKWSFLTPKYCKSNVFSLNQSQFTLYYGESLRLRTIQGITPISSIINIRNSFYQENPAQLLQSDSKTNSPVLVGILSLQNNKTEYFAFYKQNREADYAYYLLPELFLIEQNN